MSSRLPAALASWLIVALAAVSGPAAALGLGQLQVQSRPGQPLVAEIPIISSDPSELQGLQAQLASPDTFAQVGLEPPQGLISTLRFEPTVDKSGRPVIRVTSPEPVQAAQLTFLLQVDWAQGRLVREYSALVDTPSSLASEVPPPIQAPAVAPSSDIVRSAPEAAPPAQTPVPSPPAVAAAPPPAAPESAPPPSPEAEPQTAEVAPPPAPTERAPAPAVAATAQIGPVKPGQTLSGIAANLDGAHDYSAAQTMLALLRANPDAFIGGNINRLRAGAVLTAPASSDFSQLDARQAAAEVHQQIAQWRAARAPVPQPAAVADVRPSTAAAVTTGAEPVPTAVAHPRRATARLEIVPPSSGRNQRAGTQSGIDAGGEGDMVRQQLQETKETLAARDAEVGELKTRVAELEKLQQQQQQLLTMKSNALAAAQQSLAHANQTGAAATPAVSTAAAPRPAPAANDNATWLWGGGATLVVVALVGWLLTRRRERPATEPRRAFDVDALAASMPATRPAGARTVTAADFVPDQPSPPRAVKPARPAVATVAATAAPTWHAGTGDDSTTLPSPEPHLLAQAQSCLARGDEDGARVLLRHVMDGRDPAARETAARLLRDL